MDYTVELTGQPARILQAFHMFNLADYQSATAGIAMPSARAFVEALGIDPDGNAGLLLVGTLASIAAGKASAAKGVTGFAPGAAETALTGMRNGGVHAIRHLEGNLIPNTGSLQSRVDAFKALATPILENPVHTANWRIGATEGRAFLGNVNGQYLAIVVAKDGHYQGKVISSFIPDSNQLSLILSR